MKLINGDELKRFIQKLLKNLTWDSPNEALNEVLNALDMEGYQVKPQTLNLTYAAMVEELEEILGLWLERDRVAMVSSEVNARMNCLSKILEDITTLKSRHLSDPDKYEKLLVQAEAWKRFYKYVSEVLVNRKRSIWSQKAQKEMDVFLLEAHRSLAEKEEEEK